MKRLLVTGATGFVGRNLTPELARTYEVLCVVRERSQLVAPPDVQVVEADLGDPAFARRLPERVDGVLHMAVAPPSLAPEPSHAFQVNAASTLALLEWSKRAGARQFLFTSSGSVYAPQEAPITEDVQPRPADLLGVAKYASELLAGLYARDFPVVILRIWRPYGPGQGQSFLIPRLAQRIRDGQPITLFQGGHPRANTIYVEELVEVMQKALQLEHSAMLNVAHPDAPSIYDLCQALVEIVGRPAEYQWRSESTGDLIADVTRIEQALGFRATVGLREGLTRMFNRAA